MEKGSCLIIKNDGVGDLILSSGIIASLGEYFGGNVDLLTCAENRDIAENLYGINKVYYVSRDNLKFIRLLYRFKVFIPAVIPFSRDQKVLNFLRNTKYDYAICLRRFIRSSSLILMRAVNADKKLCAWQFPTNVIREGAQKYTRRWDHFSGSLNILSEPLYYKQFLENYFSIEVSVKPKLKNTDSVKYLPSGKTVGLCLGGTTGKWNNDNWDFLVGKLIENGWDITLFGGKESIGIADSLKNKYTVCNNQVGKVSFSESVRYLSGIGFFIGNDTGMTHLASLIVNKCLIILGGGTFFRFFPWPETDNQYIISYPMDCFDCDWKCIYDEKLCLKNITPELVWTYFNEIIDSDDMIKKRNLNPSVDEYNVAWKRYKEKSFSAPFESLFKE